MRAGLGWSVHSGWAVAVGVAWDGEREASVVSRHRVELVSPDLPRMAYHAIAELPAAEGVELLARVEASVAATTRAAVASVVGELRGVADDGVSAAILGRPMELPPLRRILAAHTLLHAAEGALYREAVEDACGALGLPTTYIDPRTVLVEAEGAMSWAPGRASGWLATTGKALGPPWQRDHKDASLAVLVVLAAD
jgi:hypothetical protein